ncbi:MAG TPA: hypothetical protein VFC26_07770 [Verrucomicrobiae bacterium]|nr:hypothetical protein [Verrucomicrobiae bacterium]
MKLSSLTIGLGLLYVLNIYGVLKPARFGEAARKFPRYTPAGYPLMLLATIWFVYNVYREPIADFAAMKPYLCGFFAAVGVGACIFVKDFLPVRGLAVLLLLAAKLMVDTARWADTSWRLVITTLAYVWIIAGMWLTISPWRMRDLANWITASENRIRLFTGARVAFGVFVLLLGLTVFRSVEAKAASPEPAQPMQISGESSR